MPRRDPHVAPHQPMASPATPEKRVLASIADMPQAARDLNDAIRALRNRAERSEVERDTSNQIVRIERIPFDPRAVFERGAAALRQLNREQLNLDESLLRLALFEEFVTVSERYVAEPGRSEFLAAAADARKQLIAAGVQL